MACLQVILGQQAVDGDLVAVSDIHLAVGHCRNCELYRAARRISVPCCLRAVVQFVREIRGVVRSQNSRGRIGNHRVVRNVLLDDPHNAIARAV